MQFTKLKTDKAAGLFVGVLLGLHLAFVFFPLNFAEAAPPIAAVIPDDNGDYAFAREVVPLLLGRKPKGALEVKLLGDIAALSGRLEMLRGLMESPEFVAHWTSQMMDIIRLQRNGYRGQPSVCFNNPMRVDNNGQPVMSANLALDLGAGAADRNSAPSGGDFNMHDLMRSSIVGNDLSPFFRAYLYTITMRPGRDAADEKNLRKSAGFHFTHTYLNRQLSCMGCHNEVYSDTGPGSGWNRTFPVEAMLDLVTMGSSSGTTETDVYDIFNTHQRANAVDGDPAPGTLIPFKLDQRCFSRTVENGPLQIGFKRPSPNADTPITADYVGISGDDRNVEDLEKVLAAGIAEIKNNGFVLLNDNTQIHPVPEDAGAAMAYEVALSVVDLVWEKLMGKRLTIENYFPRNVDQRDILWSLTEDTFLPGWSLKDLVAGILLSNYSNRRSPDTSTAPEEYVIPMVIDPWVAKDPRLDDSNFSDPNDPKLFNNGQGEVVRRHEPQTLFRQTASALGWGMPRLYGSGYINSDDRKEIGQFWSDDSTGHRGFNLQMMLAWEANHASCDKGSGTDWIDKAITAIDVYNTENEFEPLTIKDVVQTVKDWLIQDASIRSTVPGSIAGVSEVEALATIFSAANGNPLAINTPVTTYIEFLGAETFESKLRDLCGVYLQSPQFMLKGLSERALLEIPALRVCNESNNCDYQQMCEGWSNSLERAGVFIECLANDVVPGDPPATREPGIDVQCLRNGLCGFATIPLCFERAIPGDLSGGTINLGECPIDVPRCDPRCGIGSLLSGNALGGLDPLGGGELGARCCGGLQPGIDQRDPEILVGWLEGAEILLAENVFLIDIAGNQTQPLKQGHKLAFGDVIALQANATLKVRGFDEATFSTGALPTLPRNRLSDEDKLLFRSLENKDPDGLKKAIALGARANAIDKLGETALNKAVVSRQMELAKILLEAGANPNKMDARGNRAVQIAESLNARELRKLLDKFGGLEVPRRPVREKPKPRFMFVTGSSTRTAPHLSGEKFASLLAKRPLTSEEETLKFMIPLQRRLDQIRKFGVYGRKMSAAEVKLAEKNSANLLLTDEQLRKMGIIAP